MKMFILGLFLGSIIIACATPIILKESERTYWPCDDGDGSNGEWCWKYCLKTDWLTGKCKYWKVDKKNFCDVETFKLLRAANMRMVSEERLKSK